TGERDDFGNYIYVDVPVDLRAEVSPLQSSEALDRYDQVPSSRLRVTLPVTLPDDLWTGSTLTWRGRVYAFEGTPLPHVIGGRVHHHELIVKQQ
ncbi:MAG: hypothetical protein ACR2FV_15435, partial [Ornithinimicrobium sp.]|uniref:hypothetical protein n=1 Tax=Ornithinimicrobium sp. TaxID=1977084 RepID=UPI003D9BFBFD